MAKAKTSTTAVGFVLDETGSMYNIADDTRGAVNQYFDTLTKETPDALVSLFEFSLTGSEETFRTVCNGIAASKVPVLTEENYRPRGSTPLYDAIGHGISKLETVEADKYILVVMTDGFENASTEWTADSIKKKIEKYDGQDNWTIVYLGANQDAWAVGTAMGTKTGNTMSYAATGTGVTKTMASVAHATSTSSQATRMSTDTFFKDAGQDEKDYDDEE